MEEKIKLTAPCGLDSFNCDIHENNPTDKLMEPSKNWANAAAVYN